MNEKEIFSDFKQYTDEFVSTISTLSEYQIEAQKQKYEYLYNDYLKKHKISQVDQDGFIISLSNMGIISKKRDILEKLNPYEQTLLAINNSRYKAAGFYYEINKKKLNEFLIKKGIKIKSKTENSKKIIIEIASVEDGNNYLLSVNKEYPMKVPDKKKPNNDLYDKFYELAEKQKYTRDSVEEIKVFVTGINHHSKLFGRLSDLDLPTKSLKRKGKVAVPEDNFIIQVVSIKSIEKYKKK
jgi:hypothetical protein